MDKTDECNGSMVIDDCAPKGSTCSVCGDGARWRLYCLDCGNIAHCFCDDHAYLSRDQKLFAPVVKLTAQGEKAKAKIDRISKKARAEWQEVLDSIDSERHP